MLEQRCRENALPMFYVNMVGGQDELVFDGESLVVDATGHVIRRSAAFEPAIELIDLEHDGPVAVTKGATQALRQEEAIYKALVLGVRDFVTKNGFSGVIVGLSGGVDSALTLAIAVDALGADNVQAVMMPSRYTAGMSREDAEAEARALGVRYDVISIEHAFEAFLDSLSKVFRGTEPDTTEENIQARCRGLILMAISNKMGRMLLTTGNKSEMAVGYATLYGDMCGGFAPIKDVYKTLVYRLCHYRNSLGQVIPERVLTRAPSAELREDQLDQDSLPAYEVLDRILELSVEQDMPIDEVVKAGFDRETVDHVLGLVQRNEYKRRQSAPGVRITRRAFGRDRRYPITSGYRRN
jgi:NAD+ synthase (glutamine-hydrolysing)